MYDVIGYICNRYDGEVFDGEKEIGNKYAFATCGRDNEISIDTQWDLEENLNRYSCF